MRVLVVIGAGASYDAWPKHVYNYNGQRLPLANELFAPLAIQNHYLQQYNLMGLAAKLRLLADSKKHDFDIEKELAEIFDTAKERNDPNDLQNLFKARFYIHSLILALTQETLKRTNGHTNYVTLLYKLKDWINEYPSDRFVDIVVFNYDSLIEHAMTNVYGYDWFHKTSDQPLTAYYRGNNLRIYKPHGSINWGNEIHKSEKPYIYWNQEEVFQSFIDIKPLSSICVIDPANISRRIQKSYIPAIAIPYKNKQHFDECPNEMKEEMIEATLKANKLITIGWKGSDENYTSILKKNSHLTDIYVVSPNANTNLDEIFPSIIRPIKSSFRDFINKTQQLEEILTS
ncbi:SIR2 family protein [Candidatus Roizmanbacteria bacterium]|nr:MAG: SIR2 family protein [Candidatus Roizmanbacteria bacterium]